jgi:glucans biosynthesis protein
MKPNRTRTAILVCLLVTAPALAEFTFEDVRSLAEKKASGLFIPIDHEIPSTLTNLSYEDYQAIGFRHDQALWRDEGLPFAVEFFVPGETHRQVVLLHQIDDRGVRPIAFDTNRFKVGEKHPALPADLGYAGFRLVQLGKINREFATFLDASYFRMVGHGQDYGSSARGLALKTVANEPEEFPFFEQFWIRRPAKKDREMTVYALMDSPSLAGAYQFVIRPGTTTVAEIKAALFPRREVREFGIAPLTSMFLYGKNGPAPFTDFRPEVHDADGLLMQTGQGEWIWRPLESGKMLRVDSFQDEHPRGFGLMQRERDFDRYQDLVAWYQRRPNVWVKPSGNWGKGAVELAQLPSTREASDNVVAFWRPADPPKVGQGLDIKYELHWTTNSPVPVELGHVRSTRIGRTMVMVKPTHLRFVIEFAGAAVENLPNGQNLTAHIDYGPGAEPIVHNVIKNEITQSWRLVIEVAEPRQALSLRARLERNKRPITETWNYTWQP